MRESHIRHLKLSSRAQLLLTELTLTSKDFSSHGGIFITKRLCCTYAGVFPRWFSPMMSLTHVGKYYICTLSCQPEYSTVHSFRENHTSVFFSALYNFFQSLPWIYRELQWSTAAEHPSLSLDDVTRALCQSFHGLKKCMHGVSDMLKYANPKCSTQAYRASLCMCVCVCVCVCVWEWVSEWVCEDVWEEGRSF